MATLIAGLVIFLAPHCIGLVAPDFRARQVARHGLGPYKLAYSLLSIVGLVLIVRGFGIARLEPTLLWQAPTGARHLTAALSVIGFVLIAAAYVPRTRIKAAVGHPMTLGVGAWALGHLLSNGRLADVVLFGAFLVWSIVVFVVRRARDRASAKTYPSGVLARDVIAVAAGIVAALVFALLLHGPLIGVKPFA